MSPKYKFIYFDVKVIGEPIRLLFAHANVEYDDVRISVDQTPTGEWAKLKPQMPWNALPVLEEDGKQLSQSLTIFRYLGRKFGLGGKTDFETAKCDEYLDAIVDLRLEIFKLRGITQEDKQEELKKTLATVNFPKLFGKFNEILKKNGSGYLVGSSMTYADIFLAYMSEYLPVYVGFTTSGDYPLLVEHQKKILSSPGIKEWIAKRPVTAF